MEKIQIEGYCKIKNFYWADVTVRVEETLKDFTVLSVVEDGDFCKVTVAYFDWDRLGYGHLVTVKVPKEDVKITKVN